MKYLIPFLFLAGCTGVQVASTPADVDHSVGIAAVKSALKDPFSAKFSAPVGYKLSDGSTVYCGLVNAKNSFGAYGGFKNYYVRTQGQAVKRLHLDEYATAGCARAREGKIFIS